MRTVVATAGLALAGFAVELFAFWPGLMSVDSIEQYIQAAMHRYNDHHPPIMAWVWSWTDRVVTGPGGMLILHLVLLWTGLWLIAEGARVRGLRYTWMVPLVGVLPFVANIAGIVWKDVGMAFAFLCAGGLIYASGGWRRPFRIAALAVAVLLIAYGTMVRSNAAPAAFALLCYVLVAVFPRMRWLRSAAIGAALVGGLLFAQRIIEQRVLDASPRHLSQLVMLFDLAAISCRGAAVDIPAAFRAPGYSEESLCSAYDPDQVDTLFYLPASPLQKSLDAAALQSLRDTWLSAIRDHPKLYLIHHAQAFAGLLGLHRVPEDYRYLRQPFMQPNFWGFTFTPNAVSRVRDAMVDALADTGLFSGALWITVALLLLASIAFYRLRVPFETVLLVSALMYALPYFFFSLAANYRFLYWTVLATCVATVSIALRAISPVRLDARHTLATAT